MSSTTISSNTMSNTAVFNVSPIATVQSPFKQKFAIPRQPGLVPEAEGKLVFQPDFSDLNFFRGLEQFSHLWILFIFSETATKGFSPTVQPPRLGGKERVGVFASRSPFRPNALGISVVRNLGINSEASGPVLKVGGIDLLDGTPVVDIKPYVPYADAVENASAGFADSAPPSDIEVCYSSSARRELDELLEIYPKLINFITNVLRQDPRPAWRVKAPDDKQYGMTLFDLNIKWRIEADRVTVVSVRKEVQ